MEHVPFIIKNTSQNPIEFSLSDRRESNNYATWRFPANTDISNIDWEVVKDYEEINTIDAIPIYANIVGEDTDSGLEEVNPIDITAKMFRLMPGEAISLRNVGDGLICNPHFNIVDKGLSFDGSLLSLLPGGEMTKGCFSETFSFCIGLTETPSFSDITEIPKDAFSQMFEGCTNLEKTAEITAKKFGYNACNRMFKDCTSLKNAADMPNAKEFGILAFDGMYYGCTSLTEMAACPNVDKIPDYCFIETYAKTGIKEMKPLPASIVGYGAYAGMFEGCTNLEKASEIAAKEFGEVACEDMFKGCTSLKNAADMPNAKELDERAFWHMYDGCKSLTEMKPLPASRVGAFAYAGMFADCTNLEKASEIAAKEFGEGACSGMFEDCTSLKKPADMPNCKNTFKDMYAGCPLQPATKKTKNNTKGSKANLKHPILTQGKAKGQSKGLK